MKESRRHNFRYITGDEQLQTVEHIFDQEVPPDDYESDNESDEKHKTG